MMDFDIIGVYCGALDSDGSSKSQRPLVRNKCPSFLCAFLPAFFSSSLSPSVFPSVHASISPFLPPHSVVVAEVLLLLKFLSKRKRAQDLLSEAIPLGTCPRQGGEKCLRPGPWRCFAPTPGWYPPQLSGFMGCQVELLLVADMYLLYRPQQTAPEAVEILSALPWPWSIKSHRVSKKKLTWSRPDEGPHVSVHTASVFEPKQLY